MAKETMKKTSSKKSSSGKSASKKSPSGKSSSGRAASSSSAKRSSSAKKAAKKRKRIIIFGVEILLLLALVVGFYVIRQLDRIQKPEVKAEEIQVNPDIQETTVETMSGYTNVALFGLDTRKAGQLGKGNRSDTIIIASINNDTKEVKLVSVYVIRILI